MLKIEKFVTMSPEQYEIVVEGMRNAMNSWDRMDSYKTHIEDAETGETADFTFFMGENDEKLAMTLANSGSDHAKYRRMMPVWLTLSAPLYWWKEFDTYKVGTVANSCSTMHKIAAKPFEMEDFSTEHLKPYSLDAFDEIICRMNEARDGHLECAKRLKANNFEGWNDGMLCKLYMKDYWWQMIQLLPSSYNQKRTVFLNYEVLHNIYHARKNHKLDEWHTFCHWIEELPYSHLIICEEKDLERKCKELECRNKELENIISELRSIISGEGE